MFFSKNYLFLSTRLSQVFVPIKYEKYSLKPQGKYRNSVTYFLLDTSSDL